MARDGLTRRGTRRLQAVPDRVAAAPARDQRGHRRVPADGRVLRPRPRLRSSRARPARGGDARRGERGRPAGARRRPGDGRRLRGRIRRAPAVTAAERAAMTKAVFFDVDFTLIYPGPAFQGGGVPAILREARDGGRCRRASPRRSQRRRIILDEPEDARLRRRRSSSTTRGTSSSGWAAADPGWTRARARSTTSGPPASTSRLYDDVPERAPLAGRAGRARGSHLELATGASRRSSATSRWTGSSTRPSRRPSTAT